MPEPHAAMTRSDRSHPTPGCAEFRRQLAAIDRRSFVKAGMLGGTGLTLSELLRLEAGASPGSSSKRQNSVIILWMRGGPSHIDLWDLKPNAPLEIRGEFQPISTKVPGIQICEHLPRCARIMDKWSILRSLHHRKEDKASHTTGDQVCFTGYPAGPIRGENVHPSIGSVVAREYEHEKTGLPKYVMIPRLVPGTDSAFLGPAYKPFETQVDSTDPDTPFEVPNLANFHALKNAFLPPFDQAYSALIEDLDQRGLLDTTMVVAWGEIGRTPKIASNAGRNHWPNAMGAAVAGGGIQGGRVIGATDKIASEPVENPKLPHDVLATLYRHLGIDRKKTYVDHTGRPHYILKDGKPIDELDGKPIDELFV